MKYSCDLHVHTSFSFDGERAETPIKTAEEACKKGFKYIALTDHLDVNSEIEHLYAPIDLDSRKYECLKAKDELKGKITVLHGIELGQMTQYPKQSQAYLEKYGFDFVLGSLHNVKGMPDFALIDYKNYTPDDYVTLWCVYLDELYELAKFDGINSLSHLTYPLRYYKKNGFSLDLSKYEDKLCKILDCIIKKGVYLEVNSSGFRQGMDSPLPDDTVLSMYFNLGGRMITVGSDSHTPNDIGADFEALERYIKYGFTVFTPN